MALRQARRTTATSGRDSTGRPLSTGWPTLHDENAAARSGVRRAATLAQRAGGVERASPTTPTQAERRRASRARAQPCKLATRGRGGERRPSGLRRRRPSRPAGASCGCPRACAALAERLGDGSTSRASRPATTASRTCGASCRPASTTDDRKLARLRDKIVTRDGRIPEASGSRRRTSTPASRRADEYRAMLTSSCATDDLPRFEARVQGASSTRTRSARSRSFQPQLHRQARAIKERVDTHQRVADADRLQPGPLHRARKRSRPPNADVRDFQPNCAPAPKARLPARTTTQYSEQQFLEVKRIIERFRGREGYGRGRPALDPAGHRRAQLVRLLRLRALARRRHASTSTTPTPAASRAARRRSSPTRSSRRRLAYQFGLEWGATRSRDVPLRGHRRGVRPRLGRIGALRA